MTFNRAVLEPSVSPRLAVTFDDGERNCARARLRRPVRARHPGHGLRPRGSDGGGRGNSTGTSWRASRPQGGRSGSHSLSHARLTHLDDDALDHELQSSREAIEDRLGRPCRSIAYPYGVSDERVRAAAARAGYTAGCTTGGTLRADALGWPRVGVDGNDGSVLFRLKTSRLGRSLRGTPLRGPSIGRSRDPPPQRALGPVRYVGHLLCDQPVSGDRYRSQVCRGESPRLEAGPGETRGEPGLVVDRHL